MNSIRGAAPMRAAVGLLAVAVSLQLCPVAMAGDYYTSVPLISSLKVGADSEGATPADVAFGKEYSHSDWFTVYHGIPGAAGPGDPNLVNFEDHDAFAGADPLQVVSWDGQAGPIGGNSGSVDSFDYGVPGFNYPEGQVDALANRFDLLFGHVIDDTATLLFSVTGDIDASSTLPAPGSGSSVGIVAKAHVHYEDPAGLSGVWAAIEAPPAGPGPGPGVNHHVVEDLDALEVWGPEPPTHRERMTEVIEGYIGGFPGPNTADADRFSLDMDAASGVSVWAYDIGTTAVTPFVPHAAIVDAIAELFIGPGSMLDDETSRLVDVDGTMVRDPTDDATGGASWDVGDELLFTIDPIAGGGGFGPDGAPVALPAIDGGEIMHLVKTAPGSGPGTFAISFLTHGGHVWDTAFPVASTFGYFFEDVDALEAVGTLTGDTDIPIPEPNAVMLAVVATSLFGSRRRRFDR